MLGNWDASDHVLELEDRGSVHHLFEIGLGVAGHATHDVEFLGVARILHHDVEQKAVELRFGQRVGALLLDRVLRRQDKERFIELKIFAPG